jgi:hypothetical protein
MRHTDFRERQVLADLQRVAAHLSLSDPWSALIAPDANAKLRSAATSVLLQLMIETDTADPAAEDIWLTFRQDFHAQPAPARAALMNGFDRLCRLGLAPETCQPALGDCVTHRRAELEQALIALARQMTPIEIDHIADADYGNDADRHRAALSALLADPRVSYPPGDFWYPAEVVELVSHVPGAPGHVPCLAIVLLDALRTGDLHGHAEFRLGNQFTELLTLPEPARAVLLAAFRHIYETERTWSPSVPLVGLPIDQTTQPWVTLP